MLNSHKAERKTFGSFLAASTAHRTVQLGCVNILACFAPVTSVKALLAKSSLTNLFSPKISWHMHAGMADCPSGLIYKNRSFRWMLMLQIILHTRPDYMIQPMPRANGH